MALNNTLWSTLWRRHAKAAKVRASAEVRAKAEIDAKLAAIHQQTPALRTFKLTPAHVAYVKSIGMSTLEYAKMVHNAPQNLQQAIHQQVGQLNQGGGGVTSWMVGSGGSGWAGSSGMTGFGYGGGAGGSGHPGLTTFPMPVQQIAPALPQIKLEDGGIKLGEITAWRWWRLHPTGLLQSCSAETIWATCEPLECAGGPPTGVDGRGIYCFKTEHLGINAKVGGMVFGRIAIWGTVIEHSQGYLAQYAKIIGIDRLLPWQADVKVGNWLKHLRNTYGLPEDGKPLYG